jgi:hypothetical protein
VRRITPARSFSAKYTFSAVIGRSRIAPAHRRRRWRWRAPRR